MPTRGFRWIQDTGGAPSGNEHKGSYAKQTHKIRSKVKAPPTKPHRDKTKYRRKQNEQ